MRAIEFAREMRKRGLLSKEASDRLEAARTRILENPGVVKRAGFGARFGKVFQKLMGTGKNPLAGKARFGDDVARALGLEGMDPKQKQYVFQSLFDAGPSRAGGAVQDLAQSAGKVAPFALAALAIPAAGWPMKIYREHSAYGRMLEIYPELQDADQDDVRNAFSVVRTYAPSIAKDPVAAGAAVSKFVQFDTIDPAHLKQLLEIEGRQRQNKPSLASELGKQLVQGGLMGA